MGLMNFRDGYEFDPETYEGGGMPGRLYRYAQQYGIDFPPMPTGAREDDPANYGSPQAGLLGWLSALQVEQSRYQQLAGNGGPGPFAPQNPNFTQTPPTRITVRPSDAYSPYDPETYTGEGGGLPGRLYRYAQQHGIDFPLISSGALEYDPNSYGSPQGGLNGRLGALQAEQSRYQPGNYGSPSSAVQTPNRAQYEVDQAQQAREAAAARLARGARSVARAEAPPPDPIDIAKSAGIGLANGTIGLVGSIPQVSDWSHRTVNKGIDAVFNAVSGPPKPSPPPPNINAGASPESLRRLIEDRVTGKFYQPKSMPGRYAETIGEMAPLILGQGVGGIGQSLARGGAGAAARDLGGKLVTDAVLPGMAVQALEGAFPDSPAGQWLQKAWPLVRRGLPFAPLPLEAARRAFSARNSP